MSTTMQLLTTKQAANRIGVSIMTLTRMVTRGDITPAHKNPGKTGAYLFHETDIAALAAQRQPAAS